MNMNKKLHKIDKILIFVFELIILTLYHLCNVYIANLSELTTIIDAFVLLTSLPVFSIALVMIDYNELTLKEYQLSKLFLGFMIVLNGISLVNYLANPKGQNVFLIGSTIYFVFVLVLFFFFFIVKFSPILHELRLKDTTKNTTKNTKKEQLKKLSLK